MNTREVAYSGGTRPVSIGDRFHDNVYGGDWEVVRWSGTTVYSPSGFGGTVCVYCRPLGELPGYWRRHVEADGTVEWCADSVAAHLAHGSSQ